ncbi:MAG: glycogen debranching protein GlgX [Oscillospiraceae bacterium]|nr:glycogen debranching protein GlgX [Oscillospiraceae bacterium]
MKNLFTNVNDRLSPIHEIAGFKVRPGLYLINGATALKNGVNFTIHSYNATSCELLLFRREETEPYAVLEFPDSYRIGNTFSMIVFDIDITEFEYAYRMDGPYDKKKGIIFNKDVYLLDPYARAVTGQAEWGVKRKQKKNVYRARVVDDTFDWGDFKQPHLRFRDLIIYELHVRGFTFDKSSGVTDKCRGTFAGIKEKIPYLKELGINAVELMPIFEFDEMEDVRVVDGNTLYNYWGYNTVGFFAPNTGYTSEREHNHEGRELKTLIRELHENGIEVILDVVFNHTAEGDERGPVFSFKGIDNNIYYLLTPDGNYYNFSGCGNSLNCNHPIVHQFILDCLRHWVIEYRIDGFRFDLAAIMGRNEDGSPMTNPPILEALAFDPILGKVKLIAEAWDAGGLYQVGSFPSWKRWAEWNGKYRDEIRCFMKGDGGMAKNAVKRITGSRDIYNPDHRGNNASVNFITCHDGFTLYDLYAYNEKHNHKNGWNNTDGDNGNNSWNCGIEGETDDATVLELRKRLRKNAFAVLMCSRGAAMFLAGDEFCNTQFGNNNAYCQDNITSWLDWSRLEKYNEMFEFCKFMIDFRKSHNVIRRKTNSARCGYPDISVHNGSAWNENFNYDTRLIGVMYSGRTTDDTDDDFVLIAVNTFWETQRMQLPDLPNNYAWSVVVDTWFDHEPGMDYNKLTERQGNSIMLKPRSVVILNSVNCDASTREN